MINHQQHKLHRFDVIKKFLADHSTEYAGFTRLVTEVNTYNNILESIHDSSQTQSSKTKGAAESKKIARKKMAELVLNNAHKAQVWALDNRNADLAHVFNLPKRSLVNGASAIAIARARNVLKELSANVASLGPYNITPADITTTANAIDNFVKLDPQPFSARGHSKTITASLPALFKKADFSLKIITRLIVSQYSETKRQFVHTFLIQQHLGKMPVRHTGVTVHVTDAETSQNIKEATVTIMKTNKTSLTDIHGESPVIRCRLGTYQIQITANGFRPLKIVEDIKRGHITKLNIQLKKA